MLFQNEKKEVCLDIIVIDTRNRETSLKAIENIIGLKVDAYFLVVVCFDTAYIPLTQFWLCQMSTLFNLFAQWQQHIAELQIHV